jgi:predicted AAA+ superfamily ATPase
LNDKIVVLDELHKYERWKGFLKGIYDKYHSQLSVLVTGSARLDVYQKGGDSLLGRYYHFHLHPLSIGELMHPNSVPEPPASWTEMGEGSHKDLLEQLLQFGGFPEPFFAANTQEHRRWSLARREILVREDIRDLSNIQNLSLVEHLLLLLPDRVGSVLSVNALKEDLRVAYNTVVLWLKVLERLYISYTLAPYTKSLARSIRKERKLYLWDWSQITDKGSRFENLVAGHLFKAVQYWRDLGFGDFALHFLRDRDCREADFCITCDRKPVVVIEAKLSDTRASESLLYFADRLRVPAIQLVAESGICHQSGPAWVVSADRWLAQLP